MPHMMPMMWTLIMLSTMLTFYLIMNLIYFFYLPKLTKNPKMYNKSKWTWVW